MTSAAKTSNSRRRREGGFTLLEIVLVLLAIAVLGGGAVTMMILSSDERKLDEATGEVELLAKRARTIAGLQQRPYAIEFYGNKVTLMPLAEALMEPEMRNVASAALEAAGTPVEGNRFSSVHASWTADEETQLFVRRWASDTFIPINGKSRQVWRFDPEGFCEPVTVRYQVGKSWAETEFNPLTAAIRDLSKEVY